MIPLLTPTEMAEVDAAAPEPVEVLVERAGASVAHHALDLMGGAYGRRVVVLAGKGNNGADGRAAGRVLARRGVRVQVVDASDAPDRLPPAHLVVDAAYGTGFRGTYDAPDAGDTPVLAVDIPSGVDGTTGCARGRVLPATRTVSFAALKPGLVFEPGRTLAGEVVLADIGLEVVGAPAGVVERADVERWLQPRATTSHKWKAAVLVVAGSPGMAGAAHLAAAAAQRGGAGLVRLGSPGAGPDAPRPLEAVGLDLPADGWAAEVKRAADRFGALLVGPGLGRGPSADAGVREVLGEVDRAAVVDGDGLAALGSAAQVASLIRARGAATVLTPHDGEYSGLTGSPPGDDRVAAARDLANSSGAVVLLKGPTTVVADPQGRAAVVTGGDARLATAGTGDVLSGVIAALLSRGAEPFEAAAAGAWLHTSAAAMGHADGLVAGDLLELLPAALAQVAT